MKTKHKQLFVLIVGVAALSIGILRNEMAEVLQKAIFVCLECVGLG